MNASSGIPKRIEEVLTTHRRSFLKSAGLLVVSVVMSVTLLVPINNRVAAWTADHHPADWREQQKRWDRLHYARVAIIVAGFVLTLVAGAVA